MQKRNYIFFLLAAALIAGYVLYVKYGDNRMSERTAVSTNVDVPMHLSSFDTSTVMALSKQYLDNVVERNYETALDMLYVLDENCLPVGLNVEQRHRQLLAMTLYPVYGYEIEKLLFWRETDCRLDYRIRISQPIDGKEAASVRCAVRPVRYADIWYLTLADDRDFQFNSEIE